MLSTYIIVVISLFAILLAYWLHCRLSGDVDVGTIPLLDDDMDDILRDFDEEIDELDRAVGTNS